MALQEILIVSQDEFDAYSLPQLCDMRDELLSEIESFNRYGLIRNDDSYEKIDYMEAQLKRLKEHIKMREMLNPGYVVSKALDILSKT